MTESTDAQNPLAGVLNADQVDAVVTSAQEFGEGHHGVEELLSQMTKAVLERATAAEVIDHLGYEAGDPAGHGTGNTRNGRIAGYHTAATKAVPEARTVMDPFHVVHLAADKLTMCRQRIQQATTGHRGRAGDPLYGIRRTLNTRAELLTDKQKVRLFKAFTANDAHAAVE